MMIRHSEIYLTSKRKWDLIKLIIKYEERIIKTLALVDNKYFEKLNGYNYRKFLDKITLMLEGKDE